MAVLKKKRAVMVWLVVKSEGLALSLDDIAQQDGDSRAWQLREHFTHKVLEQPSFDPMSFDDKELADFGYAILARLHAFHELPRLPEVACHQLQVATWIELDTSGSSPATEVALRLLRGFRP